VRYYVRKTGPNTVEMVDAVWGEVIHRADYGIKTWTDCTKAGQHMKQVDRDGYCTVCQTKPFERMAGPESARITEKQ
jgi:hypothetical protein